MSWFTMNRKIRSVAPAPPAPAGENQEPPKRGPGRPRGTTEVPAARVLRPEVAGVRQESFPKVPVPVWNQMTARVGDFLRAVFSGLQAAYSEGIEARTVDLAEEVLPEAALALGRATMEAFLAQERGFRGSSMACHHRGCSETLEYQGDVEKTVKTRIGDITLKRAYYHGPCGHSVCPLDMLLGVDGVHAVMPSLQETVAWLSASMSYPETVKVLDKLCPSKFSLKAVETVTATVAEQVQEAQEREIQAVEDDPSAAARRNGDLKPGVVVVEADGGFARVRDHTEPSREFKAGVMGTLQECPLPKKPALPGEVDKGLRLVEKSYVGHFSDPDTVFAHMQTEFFRRGFHQLQTVHGISDGANWILPRIKLLAQEGQEVSLVLDWWHADQRVAQAANLLHGTGTEAAAEWRAKLRGDLWYDRHDDFFQGLRQAIADAKARDAEKANKQAENADQRPENADKKARKANKKPEKADKKSEKAKTAAELLQEHYDYFDARRHLLRYVECRERGLPIGSGAIEGGIRFIGKDRLDRSGMRWNIAGAEAILQLRCCKYSDRWDELAAKRDAERRQRYKTARRAWNKAA